MSRWTHPLALVLLVPLALPVRAADEIPDLVPADAIGAFGIRSVNELRKKGDKFLAAAGIHDDNWRFSRLVEIVYSFLGIKGGVDEDGRVLLVGVKTDESPAEKLVLVVPFTDLDAMAGNFGFKKGALTRDKLTATPNGHWFAKHCYVRDKHIFLSDSAEAPRVVARAKSAGSRMSAAQRKTIDGADIVLHLGTTAWGETWKDRLKALEESLHPAGTQEKKVAAGLLKTLESVRFFVASARIDEGLALRFQAVFPKKLPAEAVAFLNMLRAGTGSSNLKGLPAGKVIVAHAAATDGAQHGPLARLMARDVFRVGIGADNLFGAADQPLVAGVFGDLWRRVKGRRLALYQNTDEQAHGLFSLAAILDTDDPKQFLGEIAALSRFAEGKNLDLSDKSGKSDDVKAVQKLIRDLGADDFETREAASTKLNLIGEPTLPLLEKAAEADDAEVRRRVEALVAEIKERAALRRKELLNADAPKRLRPGFVLAPTAETIDGQKVDVVRVKLGREDAGAVAQMRQLLGPDWAKVRMAVVGKQVVVLVGSDLELFKKTLRNVKEGAAGLAGDKSLAAYHKQADRERTFELHVALQSLEALTAPEGIDPRKLKGGASLSSLAVAVDGGRYEINLWVPPDQFTAVVKGLRLLR